MCLFTQLADFSLGLLTAPPESEHGAMNACTGASHNKTLFGGALGVASSRLSLVRASGGVLASKEAVCGGAATEWTGWSHDLWPETTATAGGASETRLLTVKNYVKTFSDDGSRLSGGDGGGGGGGGGGGSGSVIIGREAYDHVMFDQIVRWDPATGAEDVVYDLADLLDPRLDRVYSSEVASIDRSIDQRS